MVIKRDISQRRNPLFWPSKSKVQVTFEFEKIGFIELVSSRFQAELLIEAKWATDEFVQYNSEKHWNPQLYIQNAHKDLIEHYKYEVTEENEIYYVTEYRILRGTFWIKPDFKNVADNIFLIFKIAVLI